MLVMDEMLIAGRWARALLTTTCFPRMELIDTRDTVRRDRNHPSIIL